MQQEQAWLHHDGAGDDQNEAKERYQYFMRPEPRDNMSPIRIESDELTGQRMKVRDVKIGMTRNANEENRKVVKVYLEPFPHIRIDKAKDLQGWYKSLHEPEGTRNRPCFSEAMLTEPYGGYCMVGCAFAVCSGQTINSPSGGILVDELKTGDVVWGRTNNGIEHCVVGEVVKQFTRQALKISLSNGIQLRLTHDHPVWVVGRGWIRSDQVNNGDSLELFDERLLYLRETRTEEESNLFSLLSRAVDVPDYAREQELSNASTQAMRMWGTDQAFKKGMRHMCVGYPFPQRKENQGETYWFEGGSQIGTYQTEDESLCQDSGHGSPGKVPWKEISVSGYSNAIQLGGSSCSVSQFARSQLGIRANRYCFEKRSEVHAGLQAGQRGVYRGKRLHVPSGAIQTETGQGARPLDSALGTNEAETARVVGTEPIEAGYVYDFETSSENYYTNGVLVHNCYINSGFRGYRGTGLITVPVDYGKQVQDQLSKCETAAAGYFSSFTDPFFDLEEVYHNTRRAAEAFVNVGLPIFFLSRVRYPGWAIALLKQNEHSYAQKSINTANPNDWRLLSPGALPLKQHMEDITRIKKAGIYVSIQVNPIVPGVVSHQGVERTFKMLKEAGADHVIVKFVEAGYSWAQSMVDRIRRRFGDERADIFESLFTENIGGQRTICEEYRLEGHERYAAAAKKLGLTYATCYEYRYERDSKGEITNKTGVSIGREYTTASQCHGQRVPVYKRQGDRFVPIDECPPSGCLYCASENNGVPRCGDESLGEAKARRMVDLKLSFKG